MSSDEFEQVKARLRRILRHCGWTIHLDHKPSGVYARAAKRDEQGQWHDQHIAPLYRISEMTTAKIIAVLPDIA